MSWCYQQCYAVNMSVECQLWQMQISIIIKEKFASEKYENNLFTGFTFPHIAFYFSIEPVKWSQKNRIWY